MKPIRSPFIDAFLFVFGIQAHAQPENDPSRWDWKMAEHYFDGGIYSMSSHGPELFIGGQFQKLPDGVTSIGIASIDVETGVMKPIGAGGFTYSMLTVDDELYVGGAFSSIGGVSARSTASLNFEMNSWDGISTTISGTDSRVRNITAYGQDLIFSGRFSAINGVSATNIAQYSPLTRKWSPLGGVGNVTSTQIWGTANVADTLFVGGSFTRAAGMPARMMVKRNMKTGEWTTMGDFSHAVQSMITDGRYVYVSGYFTSIDSNPAFDHYARYDTQTGRWLPMAAGKPPYFAYSFLKVGDYLYVGHFGVHRYHIPTEEWLALDGGPSEGGPVRAMQSIGEYLYVGGEFRKVGGEPAFHLTRYRMPTEVLTSIHEPDERERPSQLELLANYPNPFNPSTVIRFRLSVVGKTSLKVYDLLGREVAVIVDGVMSAGSHNIVFDASRLSSGVYLYRLESAGEVLTRKMVLLK
jgi:hypothetical protein